MHFIQIIVDLILGLLEVLLFARVIFSWIPIPEDNQILNKIVKITYQITEPLLAPIRTMIDKLFNGRSIRLDFSPIVLFFLIDIVRRVLAVSFAGSLL